MNTVIKMLLPAVLIFIISCKKNGKNVTVPTLTTGIITNIQATVATGGGSINSNGGSSIIVSGICWSKINNIPTVADDTANGTVGRGSFVVNLKNLTPNTTYYVRAYATNSAGTGYGNAISFTTGNAAPEARNVTISGNKAVGSLLTANYTYYDAETNPESGTSFQWYIANDTIGATVASISGATANTYTIAAGDLSKFIRVGVTAKSSAGTSVGTEAKSYWAGPVGAGETVTFTYNGQAVTYGVITSPVTGKKWLDRNLGAPNTPSGYDDWQNKGDLFQWGRLADGHQLINRASTTANTTAVNGTTTNLSVTDDPGTNLFIRPTSQPYDWRNPPNDNLWQGVDGTNNPCPSGWRIPTKSEWEAEGLEGKFLQDAYNQLNITTGGVRQNGYDNFLQTVSDGYYWASSIAETYLVYLYDFTNDGNHFAIYGRSSAASCKCIKE